MRIVERTPGDVDGLGRLAAAEKNALRRDRYRAVLLAIGGQEAAHIAAALGRARRSVQDWAYAYRDGGIDAIRPERRTGRRPRLGPGHGSGRATRPGYANGSTPGRCPPTAWPRCGAGTWSASYRASSA